jgi:hypothetical protein
MAKKKSPTKKHKFKHVEAAPATEATRAVTAVSSPAAKAAVAKPEVGARDFSYVGIDLRRIGFMAGGLVLIELVLYYLLVFTSAGSSVYRMVGI